MKYSDIQAMNIALCEALGLDPNNVKSIDISMKAGDLPYVAVTFANLVRGKWVDTVKQYDLVPRKAVAS